MQKEFVKWTQHDMQKMDDFVRNHVTWNLKTSSFFLCLDENFNFEIIN